MYNSRFQQQFFNCFNNFLINHQRCFVAKKPDGKGAVTPKRPPPLQLTKEEQLARPTRRKPFDPERPDRIKEMLNVNATAAILTTFNIVDLKKWVDSHANFNETNLLASFCKNAVDVIKQRPIINAIIEEKQMVFRHYIDLAVSINTPKGTVYPVIKEVEKMDESQFFDVLKKLCEDGALNKIEEGVLKEQGTFTIMHAGVFGSMLSTYTLKPKQSAAISIYTMQDRPIAVKKKAEVHPTCYIGLTYDHRIIDGREAVLFLKDVKNRFEEA